MKHKKTLLVILEQHFVMSGGLVYTDVQCDANFWDRYLAVFDELIVCARMREADPSEDCSRMLRSSRDGVRFAPLPDFAGPIGLASRISLIRGTLRNCLSISDAAIMRAPSPLSMAAYPVLKRGVIPWAIEMMMNPSTAYSSDSISHPLQPLIQKVFVDQTKKACMDAWGVAYVTEHVLQNSYPCRALVENDEAVGFTGCYSTICLEEDRYSKQSFPLQPPSEIRLAHTGKMADDRKGHAEFIGLISELNNRGVRARGILIGDGAERARLEDLARALGVDQYCNFCGWLTGFGEVQSMLHQAHFFVLPTKSEGLPRAVIEAMASGLICVANAVDGVPELLEDECLARQNAVDEYADIICRLLSDWPRALDLRDAQFERSKKYCASRLEGARREFYTKLKNSTMGQR